jgi:hypothetical protein
MSLGREAILQRSDYEGIRFKNTSTMIRSIDNNRSNQPQGWFVYHEGTRKVDALDEFMASVGGNIRHALADAAFESIRQNELDWVVIKCPFCGKVAYSWDERTEKIILSEYTFCFISYSSLFDKFKYCPHCGKVLMDKSQLSYLEDMVEAINEVVANNLLLRFPYGFKRGGVYYSLFGEPGTTPLFCKNGLFTDWYKCPVKVSDFLAMFEPGRFKQCEELMAVISTIELEAFPIDKGESVPTWSITFGAGVNDYSEGSLSFLREMLEYIVLRRGKDAEINILVDGGFILNIPSYSDWQEGPGILLITSKEFDIIFLVPRSLTFTYARVEHYGC